MPVPSATYRLQFHKDFTLRQAKELVPYLRGLGISHLYSSPLLKACPGSKQGESERHVRILSVGASGR